MDEEEFGARPLTGMTTYVSPNSPSLGVLRLETKEGAAMYVVTKQIANDLAGSLANLARGLAEFQ